MQYFSISLLFLYYYVHVRFFVQKSQTLTVLGIFAKLRKATISFVISARTSAWTNSASTKRIFMKFDTLLFFEIYRENSSIF